jgi:uracil-DNA glycosylase
MAGQTGELDTWAKDGLFCDRGSRPRGFDRLPQNSQQAMKTTPLKKTSSIQPLAQLLQEVRACTRCAAPLAELGLSPRPVLQIDTRARILVVGQAPGRKVYESGVPFDDASGERLRQWMGIDATTFYDPQQVAILPMGFCFPGTGRSGDFPPRPECAPAWRAELLRHLRNVRLTLVIGQYAQSYHLPDQAISVTEAVQAWQSSWPHTVPLPHPSPRNNIWLKRNSWFEEALLPALRIRVAAVLSEPENALG